jgi:hypothetical protein
MERWGGDPKNSAMELTKSAVHDCIESVHDCVFM